MTQFIESLTRLYQTDRIDKKKIDALFASHKLTKQEYDYIISVKKVV